MLEIKDHHVAKEIVKLVKKYFINFEKIIKRLQLTVFKHKKKMSRNIRATAAYTLNNFKRAHSKIYFDLSALTSENFRAADLIIKDMKLIKNFQANVFFDNDFVKNSSVTASKVDIIKINISISSIKVIVFKFLISKIAFVTSRKASQVEKIDQLNKSNVVSSAISSISPQIQFFNLDKKILALSINQNT